MRIVFHALFRIGDTHQFQQFDCLFMGLCLGRFIVPDHALHDLIADIHGGIQGCHGILEHHGDTPAVDGSADILDRHLQQIHFHFFARVAFTLVIPEFDAAAVDASVLIHDAHGGLNRHGFTGTGLTHDGHGLAAVYIQIDATDSVQLAARGGKGDRKVTDLKNFFSFCHVPSPPYICFILGSKASRRPSPNILKHIISSARTITGGMI